MTDISKKESAVTFSIRRFFIFIVIHFPSFPFELAKEAETERYAVGLSIFSCFNNFCR